MRLAISTARIVITATRLCIALLRTLNVVAILNAARRGRPHQHDGREQAEIAPADPFVPIGLYQKDGADRKEHRAWGPTGCTPTPRRARLPTACGEHARAS